ncbi:hypothetical protein AciX8_1613 [Granulicella mallensis MP5ACTX8]|uniref:Uncharacterized protein n=1 Tax=Granulicella mallensis (strain ATCC BAA-1857 / DSM 23137 / MP5ACTX8) TaxID=682795 RepID=G8NNS7_GRAMM|nr:hypothetical protein AciX8_1613 [Granulicella mallensis MP5ACTX8]
MPDESGITTNHIFCSPQKRHPERSASRFLRGASVRLRSGPKDPERLGLAHAVETFSSTEVQARALGVEKVRRVWARFQPSGSFGCASTKARTRRIKSPSSFVLAPLHKFVILSVAPRVFLRGAQPKDPEGFDLAQAAGTFPTTDVQARALEVEKGQRVWARLQPSGSFDFASPKAGTLRSG